MGINMQSDANVQSLRTDAESNATAMTRVKIGQELRNKS